MATKVTYRPNLKSTARPTILSPFASLHTALILPSLLMLGALAHSNKHMVDILKISSRPTSPLLPSWSSSLSSNQPTFQTITQANIKAGFRGSGIEPYNPQAVLERLDVKLRT